MLISSVFSSDLSTFFFAAVEVVDVSFAAVVFVSFAAVVVGPREERASGVANQQKRR